MPRFLLQGAEKAQQAQAAQAIDGSKEQKSKASGKGKALKTRNPTANYLTRAPSLHSFPSLPFFPRCGASSPPLAPSLGFLWVFAPAPSRPSPDRAAGSPAMAPAVAPAADRILLAPAPPAFPRLCFFSPNLRVFCVGWGCRPSPDLSVLCLVPPVFG